MPSGETTVWQATLTPVTYYEGGQFVGCSDTGTGQGVGHASCTQPGYDGKPGTAPYEGVNGSTWLTKSKITLSGETYRIVTLSTDGSGGNLAIVFDKPIPDDLLANMYLEVNPYVEPGDGLVSRYKGFAPGWTAPTAATRLSLDGSLASAGGVHSVSVSGAPTDWKMATSNTVKLPGGGSYTAQGTAWGSVTMRITYAGTPPQASPSPSGAGSGATPEPRLDGKVAKPSGSGSGATKEPRPDGRVAKPEEQGDNGSAEPAEPAPTQQEDSGGDADPTPPQPPALEGVVADYDADGDGRISSDEYLAGAADYGKAKLTIQQILRIRQAYIDGHK